MKLDRAFKPTPKAFHESLIKGIQKGEKKVKLIHKIKIATAVAALAACIVLVALAAGNTGAPAQPTPPPVPLAQETAGISTGMVYYMEHGIFYHLDEHCQGMEGALKAYIDDVVEEGKRPCPVCVTEEAYEDYLLNKITPTPVVVPTPTPQLTEPSNQQMVYYTKYGTFYHKDPSCQGMVNAMIGNMDEARNQGKQPCPICIDNGRHNCLAKLEELMPGATDYIREQYNIEHSYIEYDIAAGNIEEIPLFGLKDGASMTYERYSGGEGLTLTFGDSRGEEMIKALSQESECASKLWEETLQLKTREIGKLCSVINGHGHGEEALLAQEYYMNELYVNWNGGEMATVSFEFASDNYGYYMTFRLNVRDNWKLANAGIYNSMG